MKCRFGWCIWITGLPGSGKSTVTRNLQSFLSKKAVYPQVLSMDNLRRFVTPNPKYSEEERDMVYSAIVYAAKLLTQNRIDVIIDATANRRKYRDRARNVIERYAEIYLRCPLKICIQREKKRIDTKQAPKGIYDKAFRGESKTVPGVGVSYEEPTEPELILTTDKIDSKQCAEEIYELIKSLFIESP